MDPKYSEGEKHMTASVWLVTDSLPRKSLLVHHKKFNKWVQPGGHVDFGENPIEAAVREVREETGIDISQLSHGVKHFTPESRTIETPRYILEEDIPAYGVEPKHFHIDFMYVVHTPEQEVIKQEKESHDIRWFTGEEINSVPVHDDTKLILDELLNE